MGERSVAIVTGASVGIGAAICRHMIEAGHEVVEPIPWNRRAPVHVCERDEHGIVG